MNIRLLSVIDKLNIINLYIIFVLDFPLLVKSFFILILLLSLFVILHNKIIDKKAIGYILFVFAMFSLLGLVGFLKDNELTNILKFIFPIFTLFNIFVYIELIKVYKLEKYIYHVYMASILVMLKVLLLLILYINNILIDYLPVFDPEKIQSTWIGWNAGTFRIFVGQAIIIPIGLLLHQFFYKKISYLLLITCFFALFATQTTVLWVLYFIVLFYLIHINFNTISKYIAISLVSVIIFILVYEYYDLISNITEEKLLYSVPVKLNQFNFVVNMINENLFLGGGLGYVYDNGANTIEVVILHVLTTTGVFGFLIYSFMLFYWPIISIEFIKYDELTKILIFSYLVVLFASFSNPYLIGGSSGLFLIPLIAARYIYLQNKKDTKCI